MLDTDTKRRIDSARNILVGKVPNPQSQVEQITIALIYKFMDDMDAESEEMGGKRKFFAKDFARYGWAKLMRSGLGGHETLNLYAEAITRMPENPGIPQLFRDIFKNAYLPYRDPETLRAFLKIIDEFTYEHSECLGDAFEYLLSVLDSQGDAGQFRTPRHIIDFMVQIIDPKKNETVLDPACGTAGFLISAYKHILKSNQDKKGHSSLSPDEKGRLAKNIVGYDISPDMVRLSLVNLYLHGFAAPHIYEYDTLTSQDRWNEQADIILANPPFMSPKGGIKPHKRFSIQAKRSEVLFVDYMAEHLTPNGRAAIIVPEGIIFQSQTAYVQLRKMLVDEALVAVISLPAGVFNPYSGVKTSILILDKTLAKKANSIAFFKVENDGFDLGAQRREIDKNDLPQVKAELDAYLNALRAGKPTAKLKLVRGRIVSKEKLVANSGYHLIEERYRVATHVCLSNYSTKKLGEVCAIRTGKKNVNSGNENGKYPFFTCAKQHVYSNNYSFDTEAILIAGNGDVGAVQYFVGKFEAYQRTYVLTDLRGIEGRYLYFLLRARLKATVSKCKLGNTMPYIKLSMLTDFEIPLPPLEVQREIVAEIEDYQRVIDGARAVVDNYRPHIPINPAWPMVKLGKQCSFMTGGTPTSSVKEYYENGTIPWLVSGDIHKGEIFDCDGRITEQGVMNSNAKYLPKDSVLIALNGQGKTRGTVALLRMDRATCNQSLVSIKPLENRALMPEFIYFHMQSIYQEIRNITGDEQRSGLNIPIIKSITIPLPPFATQQAIVAEIEAEQKLVNANRELIARMEKKIQATLSRIWGHGDSN